MALTNGDLIFFAAVISAVVVPIAVSVRAGRTREPVTVPVTRWRSSPGPRRPRDPGYGWGVGVGILGPYAVAAALDAPDTTAGPLFLGTILVCWAIHYFTRRRTSFFGAVPWGMVLGSILLPCVVGLVLLSVLALFGL